MVSTAKHQERKMPGPDLVLHLHRTGDGRILAFDLSSQEARNAVWAYIKNVGPKHNDYFRVMFEEPAKPIKKGPRGQLNRHWGHCSDIAIQLTTEDRVYTKEMVDRALRNLAVREDLPTIYNEIDDSVEPIHSSAWTVEQANIVERVKQRFCDRVPLWLTEYDETDPKKPPIPYKSIQGRTRKEMEVYWREQAGKTGGGDQGNEDQGLF